MRMTCARFQPARLTSLGLALTLALALALALPVHAQPGAGDG